MTKENKEILKWWANHKWFELFKELITDTLNHNRDAIATLDLEDEVQRRKATTIQSDIKAINSVIQAIEAQKWATIHLQKD
jgi:hypothetical protein